MDNTARSVKEKNMLSLSEYQKKLWKEPELSLLFFELTNGCNLSCKHCGSRCSADKKDYIDTGIVKKVIDSVSDKYDPKRIMIAVTGGEPLLHPDCTEIVKYAHDRGFPVGMTSNGILIDHDKAGDLKEAGLDTISISLDGIGADHDNLRMSKGAFEGTVRGINALKDVDIEPQITTVVHKKNIDKLDEIYEFVVKNDIYSWRITNVEPVGRASDYREMLLDHDEMKRLFEYIRNKRFDSGRDIEVTYGCAHFVTYEYERMIRNFYFQCTAGTETASVMANGDIGACLDIERRSELIQGNVYTDDFTYIWENRFEVFRRNRAELSSRCKKCDYSSVCMGDSAHTWDYDNNEPLYCMKIFEQNRREKHECGEV